MLLKIFHYISSRSSLLLLAVSSLGISSVITQITLTRELLNVYQGNEIVIGLLMSTWLMLTGVGAWAGRFQWRPQSWLPPALLVTALLPFFHLLLLRAAKGFLALPGEVPHPMAVWALLTVMLTPYCLLTGYLLPLACTLLGKEKTARNIGSVYAVDNIGDIAGGVIYSFGLIYVATNFSALFLPGYANILTASFLCLKFRRRGLLALSVCLVPALAALQFCRADSVSLNHLYPAQVIVQSEETPYGRITVTRQAEQYNFFENGVPFAFSRAQQEAEIAVHTALAQLSRKPLTVLVISGGLSGILKEILKHPVSRLHYVELDPEMARLCRQYVPECRSPHVRLQAADGRKYLDTASQQFDAILINLPPPNNIQLNRFYTMEFYQALKNRLAPNGVAAFSLPGAENYYPPPLADLYRTVETTARQVFKNVMALPLDGVRFLVSDGSLTTHLVEKLNARNITTEYLVPVHLKAGLTRDRMDHLKTLLQKSGLINRDLAPTALKFLQRYWLTFHQLKGKKIAIFILLLALAGLVKIGPVPAVIWTSGFSAMGLEFLLFMLIQIHTGCLYKHYSLMVTLFMAGLFVGSITSVRWLERYPWKKMSMKLPLFLLEICMGTGILGLWACVVWTEAWKNNMLLYMVLFLTACIAGAQFPAAAFALSRTTTAPASRLYTADFIGAAVGIAACSVFMVPVLGVSATLFLLLCLKIASLSYLMIGR